MSRAYRAERVMNISHEGSSIFIFRDSGPPRKQQESESVGCFDAGWLDHCRARELAERAAAKKASSMEARGIHQELAQAYARMVQRAGE